MRRPIKPFADRIRRADNWFDPMVLRVIDRGPSAFGEGRRIRLLPPGRPSDLYADTLVTLNRVRAMEATS